MLELAEISLLRQAARLAQFFHDLAKLRLCVQPSVFQTPKLCKSRVIKSKLLIHAINPDRRAQLLQQSAVGFLIAFVFCDHTLFFGQIFRNANRNLPRLQRRLSNPHQQTRTADNGMGFHRLRNALAQGQFRKFRPRYNFLFAGFLFAGGRHDFLLVRDNLARLAVNLLRIGDIAPFYRLRFIPDPYRIGQGIKAVLQPVQFLVQQLLLLDEHVMGIALLGNILQPQNAVMLIAIRIFALKAGNTE